VEVDAADVAVVAAVAAVVVVAVAFVAETNSMELAVEVEEQILEQVLLVFVGVVGSDQNAVDVVVVAGLRVWWVG